MKYERTQNNVQHIIPFSRLLAGVNKTIWWTDPVKVLSVGALSVFAQCCCCC